jgi:broad specificity phosphatase PhoE
MTLFLRHAPLPPFAGYAPPDARPLEDDEAAVAAVLPAVSARHVDIVYSSPLVRCLGLAQGVAAALQVKCVVNENLREMEFGAFEGKTFVELERLPEFADYMANWQTVAPPGGELLAAFETRLQGLYFSGATPLVVTHAGVIRGMHVLRRSIDWPTAMQLPVPHLTLIEL